MKISKLMTKDVVSCQPTDTLERAAQLMWERDVGCLPVLDAEGRVVGMITDRDVCMAAYTQGGPLSATPVSRAMATQVWSCDPEDSVVDAERRLALHQLHRLPVIDNYRRLIGIVSLNDIARAATEGDGKNGKDVVKTLAAVCAPRTALEVVASA